MATQRKIDIVNKLTEKVGRAKSIVLADYRGLKHKQLEDLRRALKKTNAEFTVTKNTLLKRALSDTSKALEGQLKESTAALFAYADEVAPLTVLLKFFKAAGFGKTKGGLLGTQVLSDEEVTRLASVPARPVLLSKLVGQLNAPLQGLHDALTWNLNTLVWALNAVKKSKS